MPAPTPATSHDPLRPKRLDEFAGQPDVVTELGIVLGGAQSRSGRNWIGSCRRVSNGGHATPRNRLLNLKPRSR